MTMKLSVRIVLSEFADAYTVMYLLTRASASGLVIVTVGATVGAGAAAETMDDARD